MSMYSHSISKYQNKAGKDKYRVYYSYISPDDGKRHRSCKRGFDKRSKAVEWATQTLPDIIAQLEHPFPTKESMTMVELIDEYLADALLDDNIEPTTMNTKRSCITNHILPFFKDMVVQEITATDIKSWQRQLKGYQKPNGSHYSPTYLRSVEAQLSAIFNYAVTYYGLPQNPIANRMGSKDAPPPTIWTLDEYRAFQKQIEDKPVYYYAFEVLFWTGVRLGEMLALTPDSIDFDKKTITINKAMRLLDGRLKEGPTKTHKPRTVYAPDFLLDELREYLDSLGEYDDNTLIFPVSKTRLHAMIDKYSQLADVPRITVHALRHSHASLLEHLGIPRVAIKKRLGHSLKNAADVTTGYIHAYVSTDVLVPKILHEVHCGKIEPNNIFDCLLRAYAGG